jgi:hypothetical protein
MRSQKSKSQSSTSRGKDRKWGLYPCMDPSALCHLLLQRSRADYYRSALLGMLPPPKRKLPVGGSKQSLAVNKSMANPRPPTSVPSSSGPDLGGLSAAELAGLGRGNNDDDDDDGDDEENKRSGLMLPASVARGKAKAKAAAPEPTLDLFGLCKSTLLHCTPSPPCVH